MNLGYQTRHRFATEQSGIKDASFETVQLRRSFCWLWREIVPRWQQPLCPQQFNLLVNTNWIRSGIERW
jgi:hypothetical protein